MEPLDCTWCGSARSIEYGVCQVCLMRFPDPQETEDVIVLRDPAHELEIVEDTAGEPDAADTAVAE